jgi:hypothetical protein
MGILHYDTQCLTSDLMLDRFSNKGSLQGELSYRREERVRIRLGLTRSKARDTRTYGMSELHFSFRQQHPRQFHIAYYDRLDRTSFLISILSRVYKFVLE